jgi:hypothetical protein
MAKPERKPKGYIPKPRDTVKVQGKLGRLVVVRVNHEEEAALVATTSAPPHSFTVPWSQLSYLDESQNALRVVREATEE